MSVNRVIVSGQISHGGISMRYTPNAKPLASLTLIVEEPGYPDRSQTYKVYVPCLVVGKEAETAVETLEPGDTILIDGKLSFQKGQTKELNRLVVSTFSVERLLAATVESAN
jgi:single-stranded DNA-binding protein